MEQGREGKGQMGRDPEKNHQDGGEDEKRCEGRRQSSGKKIESRRGWERTFPVDVAQHTGQGADSSESASDYKWCVSV